MLQYVSSTNMPDLCSCALPSSCPALPLFCPALSCPCPAPALPLPLPSPVNSKLAQLANGCRIIVCTQTALHSMLFKLHALPQKNTVKELTRILKGNKADSETLFAQLVGESDDRVAGACHHSFGRVPGACRQLMRVSPVSISVCGPRVKPICMQLHTGNCKASCNACLHEDTHVAADTFYVCKASSSRTAVSIYLVTLHMLFHARAIGLSHNASTGSAEDVVHRWQGAEHVSVETMRHSHHCVHACV